MNSREIKRKHVKEKKMAKINIRILHLNPIYSALVRLFEHIFKRETEPTRQNIILLCMSMLYLNACPSIRSMFNMYVSARTTKSMAAFYKMLGRQKLFIDDWPFSLLEIILSKLQILTNLPFLYIIDDTLVEKKGEHFELRCKLFDHTAKNGSNYLYGHCFVSLVLAIPIIFRAKVMYIKLPFAHRMWDKNSKKSKHVLAYEMILKLDEKIKSKYARVILCDSWYPKGKILELHTVHGIPFVCAVRSDTALYDMPVTPPQGQRGRKPIRGAKLSKNLDEVFEFQEINGFEYQVSRRRVMTEIFGSTPCTAYATRVIETEKNTDIDVDNDSQEVNSEKNKSNNGINLFIATDGLDLSNLPVDTLGSDSLTILVNNDTQFIHFALYKMRWMIEQCYYDLKIFWNFEGYRVRSQKRISALIAIQTVVYCIMSVIPYIEKIFEPLVDCSPQDRRFYVGEFLREVEIFGRYVTHLETSGKSPALKANCEWYIENQIIFPNNLFSTA